MALVNEEIPDTSACFDQQVEDQKFEQSMMVLVPDLMVTILFVTHSMLLFSPYMFFCHNNETTVMV
jgi:hypothetical protein